jgi:hypothetical protein
MCLLWLKKSILIDKISWSINPQPFGQIYKESIIFYFIQTESVKIFWLCTTNLASDLCCAKIGMLAITRQIRLFLPYP